MQLFVFGTTSDYEGGGVGGGQQMNEAQMGATSN